MDDKAKIQNSVSNLDGDLISGQHLAQEPDIALFGEGVQVAGHLLYALYCVLDHREHLLLNGASYLVEQIGDRLYLQK